MIKYDGNYKLNHVKSNCVCDLLQQPQSGRDRDIYEMIAVDVATGFTSKTKLFVQCSLETMCNREHHYYQEFRNTRMNFAEKAMKTIMDFGFWADIELA